VISTPHGPSDNPSGAWGAGEKRDISIPTVFLIDHIGGKLETFTAFIPD
jgi:hypothetical protein